MSSRLLWRPAASAPGIGRDSAAAACQCLDGSAPLGPRRSAGTSWCTTAAMLGKSHECGTASATHRSPDCGTLRPAHLASVANRRNRGSARSNFQVEHIAKGNIRAIQFLIGHSRIEDTVRHLGVDVEDGRTVGPLSDRNPRMRLVCCVTSRGEGNRCLIVAMILEAGLILPRERPRESLPVHRSVRPISVKFSLNFPQRISATEFVRGFLNDGHDARVHRQCRCKCLVCLEQPASCHGPLMPNSSATCPYVLQPGLQGD
jgi:hypothetical protein